jgi:hypothetical protein
MRLTRVISEVVYISETDADGHIDAVWIKGPMQRSARPFDPHSDSFDPRVAATFHGSKPLAIMSWLAARQHKAGRERR